MLRSLLIGFLVTVGIVFIVNGRGSCTRLILPLPVDGAEAGLQ